jgi:uncharacterized protein (UPF0210 family)
MTRHKIRAITLHIDQDQPPQTIEQQVSRLTQQAEQLAQHTRLEVWTKRLTTKPTTPDKFPRLAQTMHELAEEYQVSYVAIPQLEPLSPSQLADLMNTYPKLFTTTLYTPGRLNLLADTIRKLSEQSTLTAARYAVTYGELVQTPYFPATATKTQGTSISLLYPSLYTSLTPKDLKKTLTNLAHTAHQTLDNFLGIDLSLSPWQDESVAKIIEKHSGVTIGAPGTITAIKQINNQLAQLAQQLPTIGYNETMLPLAEDNRLKELARLQQLKLSHLTAYTTYCVPGLDMVPIPDTTQDNIIHNILTDLHHTQTTKNKPLGLRLILAPADEGQDIDLGPFGPTPVLSPLQ